MSIQPATALSEKRRKFAHGVLPTLSLVEVQGFVYSSIAYGTPGSNLHNSMIWRCLAWTPLFFGAWSVTWGTLLSPLLGRTQSSSDTYRSRFDISRYPTAVNIFFLLIPTLVLAIILPLSINTNKATNRAWNAYLSLSIQLKEGSQNWAEGRPSDPTQLVAEMSADLIGLLGTIVKDWRGVWIAWSCFVAVLFIVSFRSRP